MYKALLFSGGLILTASLLSGSESPNIEHDYSAAYAKEAFESLDSDCNQNYSGCLNANASDYDCAGGSGNGPYYTGRVRVLGYDEYDLDRDGDGWGCE